MQRRKKRRSPAEISTAPEAQAIRTAVRILGGVYEAGKLVDRCGQAVQKWTEDPHKMAPQFARILSKATGHKVTVTEMCPDVFKGLTIQELGYQPKLLGQKS